MERTVSEVESCDGKVIVRKSCSKQPPRDNTLVDTASESDGAFTSASNNPSFS